MKHIRRIMTNFVPPERALVLGAGPFICELLAEIKSQPGCRYRIVGVVAWDDPDQALGCG